MSDALPNAELVAIAWLVRRLGFPAASVATVLPERAKWPTERFLTVATVPGTAPDVDVPQRRRSMLTVDSWAATALPKPLWRNAADQAEQVRFGTLLELDSRPIFMTVPNYLPARILGAYLGGEPGRVPGDPSGYARVTCTLAIDWTV